MSLAGCLLETLKVPTEVAHSILLLRDRFESVKLLYYLSHK